jgi:TPR repeat protein
MPLRRGAVSDSWHVEAPKGGPDMKLYLFLVVITGFFATLAGCITMPSVPTLLDLDGMPVETLLEECRAGEMSQCRVAGNRYRFGTNAPRDLALAAECYGRICENGDESGCKSLYDIGYNHLTGKDHLGKEIPQNYKIAMDLFDISCSGNYGPSCTALGEGYTNGQGVNKDPAKGLSLYVKGCETGSPRGCLYAGNHYAKQDFATAKPYYEKACGWENTHACAALGRYYFDNKAGGQSDPLALEYLLKSCSGTVSTNDSNGCYTLARMYKTGRGTPKNLSEAVVYFRRACYLSRPKHAEGCVKLAQAYQTGRGIEKDANGAHEYFRQACGLGNPTGCLEMHKDRCKRLGQPDSCKWLKKHQGKAGKQ